MKHEGFTLMDDNDIKHSMDAKTSTKTHFNETFTSMKKIEFTNGMHQHPFFDQFIKVDWRFKGSSHKPELLQDRSRTIRRSHGCP
jgi:glutathione peroxidase-family protein